MSSGWDWRYFPREFPKFLEKRRCLFFWSLLFNLSERMGFGSDHSEWTSAELQNRFYPYLHSVVGCLIIINVFGLKKTQEHSSCSRWYHSRIVGFLWRWHHVRWDLLILREGLQAVWLWGRRDGERGKKEIWDPEVLQLKDKLAGDTWSLQIYDQFLPSIHFPLWHVKKKSDWVMHVNICMIYL